MRRITRLVAAGAVLTCVLSLAACDKPAPKLTIQSGATSEQVSPTAYSFDATHTRTYRVSLPPITAFTDSTVLIDVPRAVADGGWAVNAIALNTKHTNLGGSGPISGRHTYRVAAASNDGNPFLVQVLGLRNGKADGSVWSFLVNVDNGT